MSNTLDNNIGTSINIEVPMSYSFYGKSVRVKLIDGKPMFAGRDICDILGYSNSRDAISHHCKGVAVYYPVDTAKGSQNLRFVSEADMYRLICGSALPNAQAFEAWVFEEVLPSVHRTGAYITPKMLEKALLSPDTLIALATQVKEYQMQCSKLQSELEHKITKIGVLEPQAAFADQFMTATGLTLVRNFASSFTSAYAAKLKAKKIKFGERAMFDWLRSNRYINADRYPSKYAVDHGFLRSIEGSHTDPVTGEQVQHHTTKITPKGMVFFAKKLAKEFGFDETDCGERRSIGSAEADV